MKKLIKADSDSSTTLHVQYISSESASSPEFIMESATIVRPTFKEAAKVLLEHIYLYGIDYDEDEFDMLTDEEIIESIQYANEFNSEADYIVVLENKSTGEVIIDQYTAPQRW